MGDEGPCGFSYPIGASLNRKWSERPVVDDRADPALIRSAMRTSNIHRRRPADRPQSHFRTAMTSQSIKVQDAHIASQVVMRVGGRVRGAPSKNDSSRRGSWRRHQFVARFSNPRGPPGCRTVSVRRLYLESPSRRIGSRGSDGPRFHTPEAAVAARGCS